MRVLITGASGGLGPAVVHEFLAREATVLGVARSWDEADSSFTQLTADLTRPEDCRRIAETAGDLDAAIHLMGGFAGGEPVGETGDDVWRRMLDLNLTSAFLVFRAVLPRMLASGHGRLIAVGSRVAVEPVAGLSAYGVSKAALVHLVRTLALEVKNKGITANIVLPATIDTEANRRAMPKADRSKWVEPASIAKVIAWLASSAADDVNGAVVPVYGKG
jgi:NAD(P)-dependent dehydrogenase (short-subunit alcohol dehydrogenase family)